MVVSANESLFFGSHADGSALSSNFIAEMVEDCRLSGGAWVNLADAFDLDGTAHDAVARSKGGVHLVGCSVGVGCWEVVGEVLALAAKRGGS